MKLSIVVLAGVAEGRVIDITDNWFLIGRDPGCNLRPASPSVSRRHCALVRRENRVFLRDFGSSNGTFVNGKQIRAREFELQDGDRLQVGPLLFAIRLEPLLPPDIIDEAALQPGGTPRADSRTGAPERNTELSISIGTLADKEKEKPQ